MFQQRTNIALQTEIVYEHEAGVHQRLANTETAQSSSGVLSSLA
jgi:hypothetical protein